VRRPEAVLLDVGGIFFLPLHDRILGAFARAECASAPAAELLDNVHYAAASHFTTDIDVEVGWVDAWRGYLERYIEACGVPEAEREEAHRHLDSEFADAALWEQEIPGAREGLKALADTGVRIGIITNADGMMASRLAEREILQVGPGIGVQVDCVIDSGVVGVMKPDPKIFAIALDAMDIEADAAWYIGDMPAIDAVGASRAGMHPFIIDPLGIHTDPMYDTVPSLLALAERIEASETG
jgi:putative hydrolase of the HAD superfamily